MQTHTQFDFYYLLQNLLPNWRSQSLPNAAARGGASRRLYLFGILFVVAISCIATRWLNGVEAPRIGGNFLFLRFVL